MADFRELGVSEGTLQSLTSMGFEEPTPIQTQAIPLLLSGRDIIAQALTGTGKTAAFGVPLVERVDPELRQPQAIVMAPTRELAVQVTDQVCKIGHHRGISVLPIYGGQPIGRQLYMLHRGVQVVVATPGRLLDHMRRGSIDLSAVTTLVLDEADQMLEMGFVEDVEYVLEHLPAERVTALFSATMPQPIVDLAQKYLREPEVLRLVKAQGLTVPDIDQVFYMVPFPRKLDALCRVLDVKQPERTIVFCATKRMVDEVSEGLNARGYPAEALHGDISQAMRERVLRGFRGGQTEVLVATDVAARGLDIPEVSHVINFDIPPDPEYYVHRIGRTGRYGRRGAAITFVNPREMRILKVIERVTGAHIRREEVPTAAEAEEREIEILRDRLTSTLSAGGWGRYRPMIEELLLEDHDPVDLAAAALQLVASGVVSTRRMGSATRSLTLPTIPAAAGTASSERTTPPGPSAPLERSGAFERAASPEQTRAAARGARPSFAERRAPDGRPAAAGRDRAGAPPLRRAPAISLAAADALRERRPFERSSAGGATPDRERRPFREGDRPDRAGYREDRTGYREDRRAPRPFAESRSPRAADDRRPMRDADDRRLPHDTDDRRPARDMDDRRPARDGEERRPFGDRKPKRWVNAGKPGRSGGPSGTFGSKPGGKFGGKAPTRGSKSAAPGAGRPARPKRAR
ncbi:MAG: DEAD/DEAH box helicase [Chloroflexi bacterium]|nr:DEAD/DEAH box helicase [Chloroflexota bacterium]